MQTIWRFIKKYQTYFIYGALIILIVRVFVPQLDSLVDSIKELKDADPAWVIACVVVFFFGVPVLAWQYLALAMKHMNYWLTLKVQFAGLFVSKLLPSSLGTLSLNMYYFVQQKHTVAQATAVMTANAITSGIAYAFLFILAMMFSDFNLDLDKGVLSDVSMSTIFLIILGLVGFAVFIYNIPKVKMKVKGMMGDFKKDLISYKERPSAIFMAILLNGIGSSTSLFALWGSAQALGIDLSLPQALVAYTLGNVAAGLVPVPGGLGVAEVGIYSGLILVGIDSESAISVTLLYRLISYWLPILPGYLFFIGLRKNVLAKFSIKSQKAQPA